MADGRLDRRSIGQFRALLGCRESFGRRRAQGRRRSTAHHRRHERHPRDHSGNLQAHQAPGRKLAGDRLDRGTDQRHRRADQHPGVERRDPGGHGGRSGPRFRGGGRRSAATGGTRRERDQADRSAGADHSDRYQRGNPNKDEESTFIRYDSQYETILIYYNLKVQFANVGLRKVIPNPGVWLFILSILTYCIYIVWNIRSFSRVIIQENQKLINVARKIEEKDLNIEFPQVRFNEYKDVMGAMESLSEALVKSIQKEIDITNSKAEQISFLIHDIKIPLTIIKGNVELLEVMATEDMKESISDIMNSTQQVERYIQEVIDINLNSRKIFTNKEKISVDNFVGKLEEDVRNLGNNIIIEYFTEKDADLFIDVSLLIRAINNLVLNGVERTPHHEKVQIIIKQDKDRIQFIITDRGPGFSEEALKKGTELFYTENYGRTNNSHYGLGLTFTEKVIKQHNGRLKLSNNADHFGEVLVELPVLNRIPEIG